MHLENTVENRFPYVSLVSQMKSKIELAGLPGAPPCAGMGLPCAPWWRVHVCGHSCGSRRLRSGAGQLVTPTPQARTPDSAAYSPTHQLLWSPLCFPEASGVPGRGTCAWGRTPGSDLWENLPSPLSKSPKPCPSSEVPIHTWQVGRAPFRSVGSGRGTSE